MLDDAPLAFYQHFYGDLQLYVRPDEAPETPAAAAASAPAPVATAAGVAVPRPAPPNVPPVAAAPIPPTPGSPVPPPPASPRPPASLPLTTAVPPSVPPLAPPITPLPPQRTAPPLTETPYSTLGSNARGIVILVRMDAVKFQRLPRHVFLNNILKAIGQIVEDTVLINVESHLPVALSTLREKLAARQFIGFGKNLLDVAVHKTQLYEPVILAGDAAYLPAAELDVIEEDQGRKKLLWKAMQRMFLA